MQLSVNGTDVFVATGGKPFDPSLPAVVMIHGAGFDHSTWALHSRWFAHHGYSVLAPDLPGHGRSGGKALADHRRHGGLDRSPARCRQGAQGKAGRPLHGLADCAGNRGTASGKSVRA